MYRHWASQNRPGASASRADPRDERCVEQQEDRAGPTNRPRPGVLEASFHPEMREGQMTDDVGSRHQAQIDDVVIRTVGREREHHAAADHPPSASSGQCSSQAQSKQRQHPCADEIEVTQQMRGHVGRGAKDDRAERRRASMARDVVGQPVRAGEVGKYRQQDDQIQCRDELDTCQHRRGKETLEGCVWVIDEVCAERCEQIGRMEERQIRRG